MMDVQIKETTEQFNKERIERLYQEAMNPQNIPPWERYRNTAEKKQRTKSELIDSAALPLGK